MLVFCLCFDQRWNEYSLCRVRVEYEYRNSQVESKYEYRLAVLEYEYGAAVLESESNYRKSEVGVKRNLNPMLSLQ